MTTISVTGWHKGFDKIQFNHLLRRYAGYTLGNAKRAVDRLLNGERLTVEIDDVDSAETFRESARRIGADCEIMKPAGA